MTSVLEIIHHYQRSIEKASNNEDRLLHCINKLYKLPITVTHLQETGIGRTVNSLRKYDGEVGVAAKALVLKWKAMVAAEESSENEEKEDEKSEDEDVTSPDRKLPTIEIKLKQNHQVIKEHNGREHKNHHNIIQEKTDNNISFHHGSQHSSTVHEKIYSDKKLQDDNKHNDKVRHGDKIKNDKTEHNSQYNKDNDKKEHERVNEEKIKLEKSHYDGHQSHRDNDYQERDRHRDKVRDSSRSRSKHQSDKNHSSKHSSQSHSSSECDIKTTSQKKYDSNNHKIEKSSSSSHHSKEKFNSHRKVTHRNSTSDDESGELLMDVKKEEMTDTEMDENTDQSALNKIHRHHKKRSSSGSQSDHHEIKLKSETKEKSNNHISDKCHSNHSKSSGSSRINTDTKRDIKVKPENNEESHKHRSNSSNHYKDSKSNNHKKSSSSSKSHRSEKDKKKEKDTKTHDRNKSPSPVTSPKPASKKTTKRKYECDDENETNEGIDHTAGFGFAEALGMLEKPATAKNDKKKKSNLTSPPIIPVLPSTKPVPAKKSKIEKPVTPSTSNLSSTPSLLAPSIKLKPLEPEIALELPTISPHYKPMPLNALVMECVFSSNKPNKKPMTDEEAFGASISSKTMRTKVFSGNKCTQLVLPSLYELCIRLLQKHFDALEYTGGVPYEILKPVLDRTTPEQLLNFEHYNPYIMEDSDNLWQGHCDRKFRGKKRQEYETWREMYIRCIEEQEARLTRLTENITLSQASSIPLKQTKLAFVDGAVKPPKNIQRKQLQFGTERKLVATPAARVAALSNMSSNIGKVGDSRLKIASGSRDNAQIQAVISNKPRKAPLMAKAMQLMKGRFKR